MKLFLIAAGTIITLIVVTITFNLVNQAQQLDRVASDGVSDIYNNIDSSEITMYDGVIVYGSDVVNVIKKQLSSYSSSETATITITVITSTSPLVSYSYTNSTYITNIQDFTDSRYIKPMNKFIGTVTYNGNGVITTLTFTIQ